MSGYILCQIKRADTPYYIESISTNIYSIEELCYYLQHNVYLIDETIINEHLCDWVRDELGLVKLYRRLYEHLQKDESMGNFILPIFKEIHYLSHQEFLKIQEDIDYLEALPQAARKKLKGDYLINNRMYAHAVREYRNILAQKEFKDMGRRFYASVWGNMGGAYARMFLYEEAAACYEKAYQLESTVQVYEKYLCALRLSMNEEEFTKAAAQNFVKVKAVMNLKTKMSDMGRYIRDYRDYQTLQEISRLKRTGRIQEYEQRMASFVESIRKDFHKSICL